jgi:hypothetical protein
MQISTETTDGILKNRASPVISKSMSSPRPKFFILNEIIEVVYIIDRVDAFCRRVGTTCRGDEWKVLPMDKGAAVDRNFC